jgi:hypothetical protein
MSKYAKITNNIVDNIIICDDSQISSFNGEFIKVTESTRTPSVGDEYRPDSNKFILKSVWNSWVLNEDTLEYEAPVTKPSTGEWIWNESSQEWIESVSEVED